MLRNKLFTKLKTNAFIIHEEEDLYSLTQTSKMECIMMKSASIQMFHRHLQMILSRTATVLLARSTWINPTAVHKNSDNQSPDSTTS